MPLVRISYRSDYVGRKDIAVLYPPKAPNALPFPGKRTETPAPPYPVL